MGMDIETFHFDAVAHQAHLSQRCLADGSLGAGNMTRSLAGNLSGNGSAEKPEES